MRRRLLSLAALLCILGARESGASDLGLPAVVQWELPNGLKVAFVPLRRAPVVSVQMWYRVGSKDDGKGMHGAAHLFEHMTFEGTTHVRPDDHKRFVAGVGGVVNAFTTEDATAYVNTVPSAHLEYAIRLEAERMNELVFRDEMIAEAKKVVKREIEQQEANPITVGLLRFLRAAFAKHPYSKTATGTPADIDGMSKQALEAFYRTYYVPNNALMVVVGDASEEAVRKAVNQWFGPTPRGKKPTRVAEGSAVQTAARREVTEAGPLGLVIGGYRIPKSSSPDRYALEVLASLLGGGESSRLHRRLVRQEQVAVQTGAEAMMREHPGVILFYAAFVTSDASKVETMLIEEVERLAASPPAADEVAKAKNQLRLSYLGGLNGAGDIAKQVGVSWIKTGDASAFLGDDAGYRAVTPADVSRAAKTYLTPSNRTVVVAPAAGR